MFPCLLFPQLYLIPPSSVPPTPTLRLSPICRTLPPACPALWVALLALILHICIICLSSLWIPFLIFPCQMSPTSRTATVLGTHFRFSSLHIKCGVCWQSSCITVFSSLTMTYFFLSHNTYIFFSIILIGFYITTADEAFVHKYR